MGSLSIGVFSSLSASIMAERNNMEWNYNLLEKRATEIQDALPSIVENDDWDALKEMIEFPFGTWSGKAVEVFYQCVDELIAKRDKMKARVIPDVIRTIVTEKKKSDQKVAGMISDGFKPYY